MITDNLDKALCCGCGACALQCPKNALSMEKDEKGFYYPKIDNTLCIKCGICDKVCSFKNFKET